MNYSQIQILSLLCGTLIFAAANFFAYCMLMLARRKRLTDFLTWLIPFAVGNAFQFVAFLCQDAFVLMEVRPSLTVYIAVETIHVIASLITLYGIWRLLKFIQDKPDIGSLTAETSKQEGVWPPPPKR